MCALSDRRPIDPVVCSEAGRQSRSDGGYSTTCSRSRVAPGWPLTARWFDGTATLDKQGELYQTVDDTVDVYLAPASASRRRISHSILRENNEVIGLLEDGYEAGRDCIMFP